MHGQNLGQTTKWKLDDELQKLKAENEVILWKNNQIHPPTNQAYDAKKRYYNDRINKAADDYLNEYGGKDSEETKTAWADYQNKVSIWWRKDLKYLRKSRKSLQNRKR